jgi:hypothetical protein
VDSTRRGPARQRGQLQPVAGIDPTDVNVVDISRSRAHTVRSGQHFHDASTVAGEAGRYGWDAQASGSRLVVDDGTVSVLDQDSGALRASPPGRLVADGVDRLAPDPLVVSQPVADLVQTHDRILNGSPPGHATAGADRSGLRRLRDHQVRFEHDLPMLDTTPESLRLLRRSGQFPPMQTVEGGAVALI